MNQEKEQIFKILPFSKVEVLSSRCGIVILMLSYKIPKIKMEALSQTKEVQWKKQVAKLSSQNEATLLFVTKVRDPKIHLVQEGKVRTLLVILKYKELTTISQVI